MKLRKRRECCVMGECLLFMALEQSEDRIIQNHRSTSAKILEEGIKMLENVTSEYLKEKCQQELIPPTFGFNFEANITAGLLGGKKELISQTSDSSLTEPKRCYSFDKSEMKNSQLYKLPNAVNKKRMSEAQKLRQSLKKLDLQDRTQNLYGDQVNYENLNCANLEYLKEKSVAELIMESNRKIEEKLSRSKQLQSQRENSFSSDSSYPITDYSSNQSSNDPQHEEIFIEEQSTEKPKTTNASSNLGSCRSFSQPAYAGTGYQAMKLMHSPKKSKSKMKRLYVRNKRVPRWADNLDKVNEAVREQRKDPKFDPFQIYGICLVEKLDTNVIFNGNEIYHRGSSARWNRHPYSHFE